MKIKNLKNLKKFAPQIILSATLVSCLSASKQEVSVNDHPHSLRHPSGAARTDLPWEVQGFKGETILPNVYYSEESETRQVMPLDLQDTTANARRLFIDHVIYPTIGHPELFVKSQADDQMIVVMRVEPEAVAAIGQEVDIKNLDTVPANINPSFEKQLTNSNGKVRFYMIPRKARTAATATTASLGAGSAVTPSAIYIDKIDSGNMPSQFKNRRTLRLIFDHASIATMSEGLYDLRVEIDSAKLLADWQYNSVAIYNDVQENYPIINISDAQVSVGAKYQDLSTSVLVNFKDFINTSQDNNIRNAPFITFNGDLHNGGSPAGVSANFVANNYNNEAQRIIEVLKDLNKPIFLTVGNHDGYTSAPRFTASPDEAKLLPQIKDATKTVVGKVVAEAQHLIGETYLDAASPLQRIIDVKVKNPLNKVKVASVTGPLEGNHVDIVTGQYIRNSPKANQDGSFDADTAWATSWKFEPRTNLMLYDGFYQWEKTYGPLNYSWNFQRNHYISLNSFELRQHRRSGWGMYTVNYGGWMTKNQISWLDRDMEIAQENGDDIIFLAHHDPRGGHDGQDYPYQFKQVAYTGMKLSATNYIKGDMFDGAICNRVPPKLQTFSKTQADSCMHDGLQEWMRPDPEFDCDDRYLVNGVCNYSQNLGSPRVWNSAYEMISRYSGVKNNQDHNVISNLRTILLGHTHFAQVEMLHAGDKLVPDVVRLDLNAINRLKGLEAANPLRDAGDNPNITASNDGGLTLDVHQNYPSIQNQIQGDGNRELAIIRMTSLANMTEQKYNKATDTRSNFGFAVFHFDNGGNAGSPAKLQTATYYIEREKAPKSGQYTFEMANVENGTEKEIRFDRTSEIRGVAPANSPLVPWFK